MKPDCDMTQDEREMLAEIRRLRAIARQYQTEQAQTLAALRAIGRIVEGAYTIAETINGRAIMRQVREGLAEMEVEP